MRQHRSVFSSVFPGVDLDRLVGTSIDRFHHNPEHQRNLLQDESVFPHQADIRVGPLTFLLNVTQTRDASGATIGYALQWFDVTQARDTEAQSAMMGQVAESSQMSFLLCSRSGMILSANNNLRRLLTSYASPLRVASPGFDPQLATLGSIDALFRRKPLVPVLQSLLGTRRVQRTVGPLTFDLVCTVVTRGEEERIMVEFLDSTPREVYAREVQRLTTSLHHGNLADRGNLAIQDAAYVPMLQGINEIIEVVAQPIRATLQAVRELSVGRLPAPLTMDLKGDFLELGTSVNALIQATCTITELATSIAEGDLTVTPTARSSDDEMMGALQQMVRELNRLVERVQGARDEAQSANRAKSVFLANMSHDIRTPMNAIIGFTEILLEAEPAVEQRERLEIVNRHASHLLDLINDILDLSKIEEGRVQLEFRPVVLFSLLQEVQQLTSIAAAKKGVELTLQLRGLLPSAIQSDPTRLRQILVNLVGNAIKFTSQGQVDIVSGVLGDCLFIEVRDTGVGIAEDALERVFDVFEQANVSTTRQFGGTGLGLAISRRLARVMGGDLTATSVVGQGSTFRLELPLQIAASSTPPEPEVPKAASLRLSGRRILVADDGPDNRRLYQFHLSKMGAEVTLAENGQEAVDAVLQSSGFDLVLLDMHMPIMDGYTATQVLREHGVELPILALTANAMLEDRHRCLQAGCSDFLTKPIRKQTLVDAVLKWLGEAPVEPGLQEEGS